MRKGGSWGRILQKGQVTEKKPKKKIRGSSQKRVASHKLTEKKPPRRWKRHKPPQKSQVRQAQRRVLWNCKLRD